MGHPNVSVDNCVVCEMEVMHNSKMEPIGKCHYSKQGCHQAVSLDEYEKGFLALWCFLCVLFEPLTEWHKKMWNISQNKVLCE